MLVYMKNIDTKVYGILKIYNLTSQCRLTCYTTKSLDIFTLEEGRWGETVSSFRLITLKKL